MGSATHLDDDEVALYLERIGISPPTKNDVDTLVRLHRAHLMNVPFENLDIHLGIPIGLDVTALLDKLVRRRRGGFCYELNGLFAALLRSLGYDVDLLQGRVVTSAGGLGIPFDHLCLRVNGPRPMLADVGFGASFVEPVPLVDGGEHSDETGTYTVTSAGDDDPLPEDGEEWWVLRHEGAPSYLFSVRARDLVDFTPGSEFHQTSSGSHFTHNPLCSLPSRRGRTTVRGRTVILTAGGEATRRDFASVDELASVLRDDLGVALAEGDYATLWGRSAAA